MGSYDGAECCETIGIYVLYHLTSTKKLFSPSSLGLYRDDGLAIIRGPGAAQVQLQKEVIAAFKELGFSITTEIGQTSAEFLDVVFDLKSGEFRPYRKPNQVIRYIGVDSNHPQHVKAQIPIMQEIRLSTNSSTPQAFSDAAPPYNQAFSECGYKHVLRYRPEASREPKKRRTGRKILWFNPPYSTEVSSNVTRLFLNMLAKHFPPGSDLRKLFNKNNVKVSYCTTQNIKRIIDAHNKRLLAGNKPDDGVERLCNCQKSRREHCPLQGKCLTKNLVYRADITETASNKTHSYFGQCMRTFKERYREHCTSIATPKKERQSGKSGVTVREQVEAKKLKSELAAHIWKLKEDNKPFSIKWHIQRKAFPYSNGQRSCDLCSWEKFYILLGDPKTTINSRSELFFRCKSQRDCLLSNRNKFTPKPP